MEIIYRTEVMDIKEEFSDFDRIFYQRDDKVNTESLLLFSCTKQLFINLNLVDKKLSRLDIVNEKKYQQVEVYEKNIFCVDRETMTVDVFFPSKKQRHYHKRTICFANKEFGLKEDFQLLVWKHNETRIVYRCLLGPLEDGRYMNFDLPERYFNYSANMDQVIVRVIFVSLTLNDDMCNSHNIICTIEEAEESIVCFERETNTFFEYNEFSGKDSKPLEVLLIEKLKKYKLRRMYFYYPYDFFSQKGKNKLQTVARDKGQKTDIEAFVRNRYRVILLCVDKNPLMKMRLLEEMPLKLNSTWRVGRVDEIYNEFIPIDIAINGDTGEIYCLGKEGIRIIKKLEEEPVISNNQIYTNYYKDAENS